ncbi:MAG: hypothetical protein CMI30_11715 [Opitutae bacterium]|nr:hypothetical protein [Opitutae bacterium]
MKLAKEEDLKEYLRDDWIERFLLSRTDDLPGSLTCNQWLLDSPPKRYLFSTLYEDFANGFSGKALDVGGGLTAFTSFFASRFSYQLLDLMHHDDQQIVRSLTASVPEGVIHALDWQEFVPSGGYDVVIANDLFPNVDQRLGEFLEKFLPLTREIRLSLTYYNNTRCYKVKRVDGDEIFFMRPWDGYRLSRELLYFQDRIVEPDFDFLERDEPSLFPNGRQVCLVTLKGDLESL